MSLNEQAIREVAIAEILHPTLALTRQFLAVNRVVYKEQTPCVADVILRGAKTADVYFPVEGERYYFVIAVGWDQHVSIKSVGMFAGNSVYFYAKSEERQVDELVAISGIEPTRTWEKGNQIKHNGFEVRLSREDTGNIEDKLLSIIDLLLPHKANIYALSAVADVGINIAYWGYKEQMWGIHFGTEIIQGLAALNLRVDVDLYADGPDLS